MSSPHQDQQQIMTYADLIEQWFGRSVSEDDIFTKYIFLYISFISFITQVWSGKTDRAIINNLKNARDAKDWYISLIQNNAELRKTMKHLQKELKTQPIRNDTRANDPNWIGNDGMLRNKEDWENLVEYWYRVRNNLFHGHKAPEFERDKRLLNYAYLTLSPLMEYFIEHHLVWEFN